MSALQTAMSSVNKLRLLPLTKWRQRQSAAALRRLQLRLLRHVLRRAYREVPLYRDLWDKAGVGPADLETLEDLQRFPITEKDHVRDAFPFGAIALSTDLSSCRIQRTSGSSGKCMEIALDWRCDDARALFTQRIYGMHGLTFWRRTAYLFPYPLPPRNNLGLYRNRHVDSNRPAYSIVEKLREFRPYLLAATRSDLLDLCDAYDGDLRELGIAAVCVHSEPLSKDERSHLSERFGCRIATNYYCNEVWAIAGECRSGTMHQFPDNVVLEIVDEDGDPVAPGEPGNVLVTSLNNRVQPFIRYRLGDIAAWEESAPDCACGLRLPAIRLLEGRDDDYLEYPDGTRIHPSKITVAVESPCFHHPGRQVFRDYRITQDGPSHVTVQIVPGRDRELFDACARKGTENLRRLLGSSFQVDLQTPAALDRGSRGKRKIMEHLPPDGETH